MTTRSVRSALALAALACVLAPDARADTPQVVDVIGHMPAADFNAFIGPNGYKDWGNEPSIAVNPLDPNKIVISGFGYSTSSTGQPGASLWYSTDGGTNWGLRAPVTSPGGGVNVPNDWTFQYDSAGVLHAAVLGGKSVGNSYPTNIYHGTTTDPNNDNLLGRPAGDWSWTPGTVNQVSSSIGNADQPYMTITGNHVYIGYDNFNPTAGDLVRASISNDNGATFTDTQITGSITGTWTNPGTRLASDANGNAYVIYGIGTAIHNGNEATVDWRIDSYHPGVSGATWDHTATNGILVDTGLSHQIDFNADPNTNPNPTWFGGVNELRGNTTAIASDASGSHIYAVYGKEDSSGLDRLYIEQYQPSGGTLVGMGSHLFSVAGQSAALPSVAVTADGTVWVEYDSYLSPDPANPFALGGTFALHLDHSTDGGVTFIDQVLYTWTAPAGPYDNAYGYNRELGDYQVLTAMGNTVYGTFAARGNVHAGGIDTTNLITPFYFTATVPEPASLALTGLGLGVLGLLGSRRSRRAPKAAA